MKAVTSSTSVFVILVPTVLYYCVLDAVQFLLQDEHLRPFLLTYKDRPFTFELSCCYSHSLWRMTYDVHGVYILQYLSGWAVAWPVNAGALFTLPVLTACQHGLLRCVL